jgi:hypothetical protein
MDSTVSNIEHGSISVAIASKGRPDFVRETIGSIQRQALKTERHHYCRSLTEDLPAQQWGDDVKYIVGSLG